LKSCNNFLGQDVMRIFFKKQQSYHFDFLETAAKARQRTVNNNTYNFQSQEETNHSLLRFAIEISYRSNPPQA